MNSIIQVEKLHWFEVEMSDKNTYVRFSADNWAVWMGESLEILQHDTELLEALFQQFTRKSKEH